MSVERICLGTAQLGMDYGVANRVGRPTDSACDHLLHFALQEGVTCWDTAPVYGDAESRIGEFLSRNTTRRSPRIVSKLKSPPADLAASSIRDWVADEMQASLIRLRVNSLFAWLAHDPNSVDAHGSVLWEAMVDQQSRGLVERIGVSVYSPSEAWRALELPGIGAIQLVLNLFDLRVIHEGVLKRCADLGVTVFARSAMLQGVFALDVNELPDRISFLREPLQDLIRLLKRFELTPQFAAIPFVLSQPEVSYVVIGVDNVAHLQDNLQRTNLSVPAELQHELLRQFSEMKAEHLEPRYWPKSN